MRGEQVGVMRSSELFEILADGRSQPIEHRLMYVAAGSGRGANQGKETLHSATTGKP
jgi:hypothetical protein